MKKALLFLLALSFQLSAQRDFSKVQIQTTSITDNVHMLKGSGGNIAVFTGEEGTLIIDAQFAGLSDKIKLAIDSISDNTITYLVNTHWHGDHTGGNENFARDGATIIAHHNVRSRLSSDQTRPFGRTTPASPEIAWPSLTFSEDMEIHMNGESLQLIHVHDAHTDGDAFVYFPQNNVLHMGDCFFKDRFPYIDLDMGGTVAGYIQAVDAAIMICDEETKIIPGHGDLASMDDLRRYKEMLVTMKERVYLALDDLPDGDTLNVSLLTEDFESWGTGFIDGKSIIQTIQSDKERQNK